MDPSSLPGRFPPVDQDLRDKIRAEQLKMLFGRTAFGTVVATGFAVLLTIYASHQAAGSLAYWWLALKVATALPRIVQEQAFFRLGAQPSQRWHQWAIALILLDGMCWGLAGLMLVPAHDQETATVICASLIGVASVATFTLHANGLANTAYCLPMIAFTAITLLMRDDTFGLYSGSALLLFITGLLLVARKAQRDIYELLWRRFLMDRIVSDKDEALREAERQNIIKSQFVATMSHELRTPLHGILGLTRMLLDRVPDANHRKKLGLVERSGEHLLSIINHILDFSRIDAGHLQIAEHVFDLDALLDDVVSLSTVSAQSKGLTLRARIQIPKPCWVKGDPPKVRQVLLNLLGNAIKFTESGRIEIHVSRQGREGPVVVRVEDSGIGITPDDLANIFDPYKQAGNAVGRAVGGTGLGLTISREISRAMGGDIVCTSEVGRGSVFEFTVPLTPCAAPDDAASDIATTWETLSMDLGADMMSLKGHVLLAEDNDVNALIVETQLKRLGLTVEQARDGQEAFDRLMRTDGPRPDLVLMDCQMPRMDGFETTRRLRDHERTHNLSRMPVVALTASAMAEDSERCLRAGMDAHLPKPFHDNQLTAVLARFLGSRAHLAA